MKSFIIICILMLFAFTGYTQTSYEKSLEENLVIIRETEKWAKKYGIKPLHEPLKVSQINEPQEAHHPNDVFVWVLVGLGAGLVLGSISKESNK